MGANHSIPWGPFIAIVILFLLPLRRLSLSLPLRHTYSRNCLSHSHFYIDYPLNNIYNPKHTGQGVHAYIFDTGLDTTHPEFENRADCIYDASDREGLSCDDGHGHGTHVAGTVGGKNVGIAKKVKVHGVKIVGPSGMGNVSL